MAEVVTLPLTAVGQTVRELEAGKRSKHKLSLDIECLNFGLLGLFYSMENVSTQQVTQHH